MPPKPKEVKKEKSKAVFSEVEKTFLELQLAECHRKNGRLLQSVADYELQIEELQKAYDTLDEDRADIIAYLKKQLTAKTDENTELKEKVKGLEELREIETQQFKETVAELEKNFTIMKDQLTSENKLLAGKLNTLEEFRALRDDLMKKFEDQEKAFEEQEIKYKRLLYEAEKKFVIGKDKLKKEMEARLLKLAQDFQDATELRIAASTHRVIRENIAINNELDSILQTQAKLADLNEKFKESEKSARIAKELAEEERDKAINKNVIQLKVIDQLTTAFQETKKEKALFEKRNYDFETLQSRIEKCSEENERLQLQVRILEQNLHARLTDQNKAFVEATKVSKENNKLKRVLKEAGAAVQAALKLDEWAITDPHREAMNRQVLLTKLLEILSQYREVQRADSMDTLASFGKVYEEGDLGFVPKPFGTGKKAPTVTAAAPSLSKESITKTLETGSSGGSRPVSLSSLGSIKTIPSVHILPMVSGQELTVKDSLESMMDLSSSSKTLEEEQSKMTDMEQKLQKSKVEVQKSLMMDLQATISMIGLSSKGLATSKSLIAISDKDMTRRASRLSSVHFDQIGKVEQELKTESSKQEDKSQESKEDVSTTKTEDALTEEEKKKKVEGEKSEEKSEEKSGKKSEGEQ